MINSNELRINNLVTWDSDKIHIVNELREDTALLYGEDGSHVNATYKSINPIKLTDNIIQSLGFEYDLQTEAFTGKRVFTDSMSTIAEDGEFYNGIYSQKLEYLHQLQNLYFALFSQELKIERLVAAFA